MILIQKGWLTKRLSKAKQTSNSEKEKKKKPPWYPHLASPQSSWQKWGWEGRECVWGWTDRQLTLPADPEGDHLWDSHHCHLSSPLV